MSESTSTPDTLTLTDFLLARIAEDEAVLTEDEPTPHGIHLSDQLGTFDERCPSCRLSVTGGREGGLAECEAKRRIVELCRPTFAVAYRESERLLASAFDQERVHVEAASGPIWPNEQAEDALRALAAVYADHDDYRSEWA